MKSRELTPEFRKKFVMKIGGSKGKDAVLYNGLLALAHEDERYGHIRAYITQYPSPENKFTAFARAEIRGKDGEVIGMEEADASAANCGKMTAASFPRMALTRAKGRAFRDFLNVDMVTMEEVQVYEPDLASPKSIGKIKSFAKAMKMKKIKLFDELYNQTGTDQLNELTEQEATDFIKHLEQMKASGNDEEDEMDFSEED